MNRVHLVLLWHMHQPQYRDPSSGEYVLPWTRLHALKDYWGMVKILEEFPGVHATFNIVPSLARQIEEYASGSFREPWFELAFRSAEKLGPEERREVLERGFQVNRENLLRRWPRFIELHEWLLEWGSEAAVARFSLRDWRDLQALSQLAWMDEYYLTADPVVSALARRGADFAEADKQKLREKQLELLRRVLPEYRRAAEQGQIEISTTPFFHPILPLLCDSDVARVANPHTPVLEPAFRHPEDAREQLVRARRCHERLFGRPPNGLWPSEGSVSDEALEIAAALGFRWFATDEGILGRTLNIGFERDCSGFPANARELYAPWRLRRGPQGIVGLFRDHYLSDLLGFVYSRMNASDAAADLHRRIRAAGERISSGGPVTLSIILDGENAWEYYPENGREFLRRFYQLVQEDAGIRALTVSEAIEAYGEIGTLESIFPGSWIQANFDIWIGHAEDIRAWELLRAAHEAYTDAIAGTSGARAIPDSAGAYESLLAAEGSDWSWWFGPEHSSANDAEFDRLFRGYLTDVYTRLGLEAPQDLAQSIKRKGRRARAVPPSGWLEVFVDGRESSYFEWLGAGSYSAESGSGAMHGQTHVLGQLFYGFSREHFYIRVDCVPGCLSRLHDCEIRLVLKSLEELRVNVQVASGQLAGWSVERDGAPRPEEAANVAVGFARILEVAIPRGKLNLKGCRSFQVGAALWQGGLPLQVLPAEGMLEVALGEEVFGWPLE